MIVCGMPSQAMPVKLVVVLILLSLSLALDLYNLVGDAGGTSNYIRIALNIGLLVGLLRGQEWARVLSKVVAVLSLIGGGFLLIALLAVGGAAFVVPVVGIFAYVSVALILGYGVFLLWCMSQPDVLAWLQSRQLRD